MTLARCSLSIFCFRGTPPMFVFFVIITFVLSTETAFFVRFARVGMGFPEVMSLIYLFIHFLNLLLYSRYRS